MRYAYTEILIVTCYRRGRNAVVPSLWLRYAFASGSLPSMEHQRIYNGFTTDLERNCIGGCTRAFFASLHRFLCGVNEFSMMSTKSGLCKPFQENDNLSSIMSTTCSIITTKNCKPKSGKDKVNLPQINACCYVIETIGRLYLSLYFMHNSLILFVLNACDRQAKSRPVTSNR